MMMIDDDDDDDDDDEGDDVRSWWDFDVFQVSRFEPNWLGCILLIFDFSVFRLTYTFFITG